MADFGKTFGIDQEKATGGVWFPVADGHVLIARMNNPNFKKILRKKTELFQVRMAKSNLTDEENETILNEVMAEAIVLDWKNFTDGGKKVPYSSGAALKLLTKYEEFRSFVAENSQRMDVFKTQSDQSTEKNLLKPLSGKQSGESTPPSS